MSEWTTNKPDKPGWYWWRAKPFDIGVIVYVYRNTDSWRMEMTRHQYPCVLFEDGEWQGPIVPKE